MALYPYHADTRPLGQFDLIDGYANGTHDTILGGEIGTIFAASRTNSATEQAAADVLDGYTNSTDVVRPGVANRVLAATARPLWLLDEGLAGYGTLFGQVIGTPAGLSTTGTNLGPHTSAASGKVTAWNKPGVYAVTLDATNTTPADGINLDNSSMDPGLELHVLSTGRLTPAGSAGAVNVEVGRFIEFETAPSLVTTPASLAGTGSVTAVRMVFDYNVE